MHVLLGLTLICCVTSFLYVPRNVVPSFRPRSRLLVSKRCIPQLQSHVSIFNSLTRRKEKFVPLNEKNVKLYSCGPTVYDYAHIGNFRAFLMYDVVKRWLQYCGYCVDHVCNLTDVDDKIIAKMLLERQSLKAITQKYVEAFFKDLDVLNIIPARAYPKATEHISTVDGFVKELVEKDHAYVCDDSVYFRVSSFPAYGQLTNVNLDKVRIGTGESGPNQRLGVANKENMADFALWKASSPADGGVSWEGTYSRGRPGWHIECSAMCRALLGASIDIHAGGVDLQFPHHENEIAQSEAATGKKFSRFWMHNGFVSVDNQKMSKSLQNFKTLRDILKQPDDARAFRYMIVTSQYRSDLSFTEETWTAAQRSLRRIDKVVHALQRVSNVTVFNRGGADLPVDSVSPGTASLEAAATEEAGGRQLSPNGTLFFDMLCQQCVRDFEAAMCDDLNAPRATAALFVLVGAAEKLLHSGECTPSFASAALEAIYRMDEVYGVLYDVPRDYFPDFHIAKTEDVIPKEVLMLAERRMKLKTQQNFGEADSARHSINELGYNIVDSTDGYVLSKL